MPQLVLEDWAPQLIWLAISFIGLYLIMARVALPKIGDVIEKRRDRILHDLDEAQRLKNETEQAIAAYESALAEARAKAHGIAQETRDKLKAEADRQRADLEAQLQTKTAEAESRIAETTSAALAQLRDVATDTAGAIYSELVGDDASPEQVTAAVDKTLGA